MVHVAPAAAQKGRLDHQSVPSRRREVAAQGKNEGVTSIVLFDLDNTLVDRASAFRCWAEAFARDQGLDRSAAEWLCGHDDDGFADRTKLFEAARQEFSLESPVQELIDLYRTTYPVYYESDPDVIVALRSLRRAGWRLGVVTNGPRSQVEKIERSGLRPFLDAWTISDELGWTKPDARLFAETIRRCGGDERSLVWMVGDTASTDIEGGREAGCKTVWLRRGRSWQRRDFTPDAIVDSVTGAIEVILAMSPGTEPDSRRSVDL